MSEENLHDYVQARSKQPPYWQLGLISFLAGLLVFQGVYWFSKTDLIPISIAPLNEFHCPQSNPEGDWVTVITSTGFEAGLLFGANQKDGLCADARNLEKTPRLLARWGLSENEISTALKAGEPGLIFTRPHQIQPEAISKVQGYVKLAGYPDYAVAMLTRFPEPEMTRQWLSGKKIGILANTESYSGHIVPMGQLRRLGVINNKGISETEIIFADSHEVLRQKLSSGEVDVIFSYQDPIPEVNGLPAYVLAIEEARQSSSWFIHPSLLGTPLHCLFVNHLQRMAAQNTVAQFSQVIIERRCDE